MRRVHAWARIAVAGALALGAASCADHTLTDDEAPGPGDFPADDPGRDTIPEQFPEGFPTPEDPAPSPSSAPLQPEGDPDIGRLDPDLPGGAPSPFVHPQDESPGPLGGPGGPQGEDEPLSGTRSHEEE